MILQKKDLTERIHKDSILKKIKSEGENKRLLLEWAQLDDQPIGWRATWLLRHVLEPNDLLLQPEILSILDRFNSFNPSQKREWLRALEHQKLNENEEGKLYDLAITEWKQIHNHPALRAAAVSIVLNILRKYPELKEELVHLMSTEYLQSLSPGIQRSVIKSWNRFLDKYC